MDNEYTLEFIPTPDQMIDMMEAQLSFKIIAATSHRMYYLIPLDEIAEFSARMAGVAVLDRANGINSPTELFAVARSWDENFLFTKFEAWRNEFNERTTNQRSKRIPQVY